MLITSPSHIPTYILDSLLHHVLFRTIDFQSFIPFTRAATDDFKAFVLFRYGIRAPKSFEEFLHGRLTWDVHRLEWDLRRRRQLPRRNVCLENMRFGVFWWEKVVVPRFASRASRAVCHLRCWHGWVYSGIRLRSAR